MADETKEIELQPAPAKKRARRSRKSDSPAKPAPVPAVKARLGSEIATPDSAAETQLIPEVQGPPLAGGAAGNGSGNGNGKRAAEVRPVKARLGETYVAHAPGADGNGGSAVVDGARDGDGLAGANGGGEDDGLKARVTAPVAPVTAVLASNTTSTLSEADLTEVRRRLKREEWLQRKAEARGIHRRPLPHFLMRHRAMRATARVGHARALAAGRRFGTSGPAALLLRVFLLLTILAGLLGVGGVGGGVAAMGSYVGSLPPVTDLHGIQVQTTKIYDRNGIPLFDIVDEETGRRQYSDLKDISPLVISATIATEDATFYTNPGVDLMGILRAVYINYGGKGQSGASTITQQVVRQVNLPEDERTDRTLKRKIREAIQAVRFTQYYSKDDILEMYLNENYYGHRAYGIGAASLTFFGKTPKDLTLSEAAMLAGMPQAPTEYDPFVNPDLAKRRQAIVLDLMAKQGMITEAQAEQAKAETLVLRPYQQVLRAPHFVYYVKDYLEKLYGPDVTNAGLVVTTTLDLRVQEAAEKVARDRIDELRKQKATNASIVIMRPGTGEILGMVGSVDYSDKAIDGQVNVATRERQPGSSFKPITYVTAFKKGWTPATTILDVLTSFPNPGQKPYIPKNYDGRDHGWVTVREALGNSLNIPAVKTLQFAGVQDVIDTAHDLGIKGLNRGTGWYGLSLTLGGGEVTLLDMTNAYSTFANYGAEVDANPILEITDPQGRVINCNAAYQTSDGGCSSQQQRQLANPKQVLDPRNAYMITSVLSDNKARAMEFGLNSPLKLSFPAAAKTGTTDDNRDSWTLGYTPNLAVGVWVGNSNNAEMLKVTGAIGAAVIWHNMMETFYSKPEFVDLVHEPDGSLTDNFVQPPGLVKISACSAKGQVQDLFLKEAQPKGCVTYKDKNKQLSQWGEGTPRPRGTPIPGGLP